MSSEESLTPAVPMPSGLSKAGFRPSATQRDLKIRLFSRAKNPPHRNMTKEEVEVTCGARVPDSLWDNTQFRHWLLTLHPQHEWEERLDYLVHLMLDRIEVVLLHGDDKVVANLAKILPDLAGKVKRQGANNSAPEHLQTLTEEQLLQIVESVGR